MRIKRIVAASLISMMILSLTACGGTGKQPEEATEISTVEDTEAQEEDALDEYEAAEEQSEISTESSLKGTGPKTLEDTFSTSGGDAQAQLKDGEQLVNIDFDDNDLKGFTVYTNGGSCELKASDGQMVIDI